MRFPSLSYVRDEAAASLRRFPWVVATAVFCAAVGIAAMEADDDALIWRTLVAGALALAGLLAMSLTAERFQLSKAKSVVMHLAVVVFAVCFAWWSGGWSHGVTGRRVVQFALTFHLLVAYLPFVHLGEVNGFWQYNRHLFLRFLNSALFSAVLYIGLAVALLAIDRLLGIDVDEAHYGRLFFVVAFLFNTWHFVSGIPEHLAALEEVHDYPRVLKIFAQYILIPLVTIYLVILMLYLGRIAITREWPSGWIGYMVSSVAVVGILALLLVHPIQSRPENKWVASFLRLFYLALIPAIIMLFLAIGKRVNQYGITENRYFLIILSVWLSGIAIYFLVRRPGNIKVIPASLAAVALVTTAGPWSAYAVAKRSQLARFEHIMSEIGALGDGKATKVDGVPAFEDRQQLSSVVDYLIENHSVETLQPYFAEDLEPLGVPEGAEENGYVAASQRSRAILDTLGIDYVADWEELDARHIHHWSNFDATAVDVENFDVLLMVNLPDSQHHTRDGYSVTLDQNAMMINVEHDGALLGQLDLSGTLGDLGEFGSEVPAERMRVEIDTPEARLRLNISALNAERQEDDSINLNHVGGYLLIGPPKH